MKVKFTTRFQRYYKNVSEHSNKHFKPKYDTEHPVCFIVCDFLPAITLSHMDQKTIWSISFFIFELSIQFGK